jgi:hypothetical protein
MSTLSRDGGKDAKGTQREASVSGTGESHGAGEHASLGEEGTCAGRTEPHAPVDADKKPRHDTAKPVLTLVDSPSVPFLPMFGSKEEQAYIRSWGGGAVFARAVDCIPDADIDHVAAAIASLGSLGSRSVRAHIAADLAYCRLSNRICDSCLWKPAAGSRRHESRLRLCSECCLAWFCSENCREAAHARTSEKNSSKHLLRCGVDAASAPLDDGPMCIALLTLK